MLPSKGQGEADTDAADSCKKEVPRTWTCGVCQVVCSGSALCGGCRKVAYCGKEHQVQDRAAHRPQCFFPFIQKGGVEVTRVLQFDISLLPTEIKPRIWRRIQVPKNFNYRQFHRAIQILFGWHSIESPYHHVHQFIINEGKIIIGIKDDDDRFESDCMFASMSSRATLDERKQFLKDHFKGPGGGPFGTYRYYFEDHWATCIRYEGEFPSECGVEYPRCLAGERAGIAESAGGSRGYRRICKIIKNPQHKKYQEIVEWLETTGKPNYNPDNFDPSEIIFA